MRNLATLQAISPQIHFKASGTKYRGSATPQHLEYGRRVREAREPPPLPAPLQDPHQEAARRLSLSHLRPVPFLFSGLFAPSLFTLSELPGQRKLLSVFNIIGLGCGVCNTLLPGPGRFTSRQPLLCTERELRWEVSPPGKECTFEGPNNTYKSLDNLGMKMAMD